MTLKFRSDASGGAILNENDVEVIKIDSTGGVSSGIPGEFKYFMRASAPAGWVVGNGQTIGSPSSGATRANNDTLALFTAWWTDYTNAQLPILTSAGGASTRGASAAADWAANKRLTVFDLTDDRLPVSANGGTVNGTKYEDQLQAHGHIVIAENVSAGATDFNLTATAQGAGTGTASRNSPIATTTLSATTFITTSGGAVRSGSKTLPPRIGMLGCFKL